MLDIKKVRNRRRKLLKAYNPDQPVRLDNWKRLVSRVENPIDNEHRYHAWQASVSRLFIWIGDFIVAAVQSGSENAVPAMIGLFNANFLYSRYMRKQLVRIDPSRAISRSSVFGDHLLHLHASGYSELATSEADYSFSTPDLVEQHHRYSIESRPQAFSRDRTDWFALLFSLTNPQSAAEFGITPSPEDFGPFWLLLENWNSEDPTIPANSLQAAHEFLLANAIIGSNKAVHIVGNDALFWDYLVRAINQRRAGLNLDPIVVETYMDEDLVGDAPIPFARDNIFWPSHLRYCEELNIPPYELPGEVIDVRLDPQTGLLDL